jgi:pimeloyl-ACP methyl ester carboxylesterase
MEAPETRYVAMGDADVAYQVVGDGPLDLLYCYGLGSHVEVYWDTPAAAGLLTSLATFSRLIFFDRRGTGASDVVSLKPRSTAEHGSSVLPVQHCESDVLTSPDGGEF